MSMSGSNAPFITLGRHLKYVREQLQQSLEEVAGAVEIDEHTLQHIEAGQEKPAEEILLLLISYYGLQDQQAVQLWQLADYSAEAPEQIKQDIDPMQGKAVVMLLAVDTRTMYSDGVDININPAGLTLSFTQATGKGQAAPIARVGMSLEQAIEVNRTLQIALIKAQLNGPKQLPPQTL